MTVSVRALMAQLPAKFALDVTDVENDFFDIPGAALPVPGSSIILPEMQEFIQTLRPSQCKAVLAKRDWHDAEHKEFAADGTAFPAHCVKNTWGAKYAVTLLCIPRPIPIFELLKDNFDMWAEPDLQINGYDQVTKINFAPMSRDAYLDMLRKQGIDTIVEIGVASDICVRAAIVGYVRKGFKVVVVRSLVKGLFQEIDEVVAEIKGQMADEGINANIEVI